MMPTYEELVDRFQSRRVAMDVFLGLRPDINSEHWWWWNPVIGLERLERERAVIRDKTEDWDFKHAKHRVIEQTEHGFIARDRQ